MPAINTECHRLSKPVTFCYCMKLIEDAKGWHAVYIKPSKPGERGCKATLRSPWDEPTEALAQARAIADLAGCPKD
jgi:hypothetical protein